MSAIDKAVSRFFKRISDYSDSNSCWVWIADKDRSGNYGKFKALGLSTGAHRWLWIYLFGKPQDKQLLHHKCDNKLCVNPSHLECVSVSTHRVIHTPQWEYCKNGHELKGDNLYIWGYQRQCRTCNNRRSKEYRERKYNG